MAERLPGLREPVALLMERLFILLDLKENPKLEWVLKQEWSSGDSAAVFAMMAMRKSFGADLITDLPACQNNHLEVITSLEQLGGESYSTLVMPGTLQYLSHSLFMKLFHQGEYKKFYLLLYEGESHGLKSRLQLPDSWLFPGQHEGVGLTIDKTDVFDVSDDFDSDEDQRIPERLFGTVVEAANALSSGSLSRFVVSDNGTGLYIAENERVRVWRPSSSERLVFVYPVQLLEGDFVVLENGERQELLDHSDSNSVFSAELDALAVWRKPLRAMLLSRPPEEIANLMGNTKHLLENRVGRETEKVVENLDVKAAYEHTLKAGKVARNLQTNISKWADGQVYGPGDLQHMLALIQVLADSGYLHVGYSNEDAAKQWFKDLERLRSGRRVAGMKLSDQIDRLLEDCLEKQTALSDGLELTLGNGMLISVYQVAMISDQVSTVSGSLLKKPV